MLLNTKEKETRSKIYYGLVLSGYHHLLVSETPLKVFRIYITLRESYRDRFSVG